MKNRLKPLVHVVALLLVVLLAALLHADAEVATTQTQSRGTQTCSSETACGEAAVVSELVQNGFTIVHTGVALTASQASLDVALLTDTTNHLVLWLRNQETGEEWKTKPSTVADFVNDDDRIPHATFDDYVSVFKQSLSGDLTIGFVKDASASQTSLEFRVPVHVLQMTWTATYTFPLQACGSTNSRPTLGLEGEKTVLRVPEDVHWFLPNVEGWLCDYQYVRSESGSLQLRLLPRGEGLGRVLVYAKYEQNKYPFYGSRSPHPFWSIQANFLDASANKMWIVAINQWGLIECVFAKIAAFGETMAFTGLPAALPLRKNIGLVKASTHQSWGHINFRGIQGTDETTYAFV